MNLFAALLSACAGIILASIYKLFFAFQQRRVFHSIASPSPYSSRAIMIQAVIFGSLRILVLAGLSTYLLLSWPIHPILVSIFFVVTWLFLLIVM